ncbi:histidine phosphatase superfamily [Crassisporium funariophilum]|nr:histidine phosphatase superfamily [Crassisporium funariophilum]
MIDKIYIARHGFRLNWISTNWQSPTGLPRDPPLTAYGETQALELAEYFQSIPEEERPTAIFSSPYYRCLQTSQPVAKALNIPIYVEHGIAEWYSPVAPGTGLHPRPGPTESLQSFFPEVNTTWSSLYYPSRKGETIGEVHDRLDTFAKVFLPALEHRLPGAQHERLLLVTHAATAIALVRTFVGDREIPMKAGCCSLSKLKRKSPERAGPKEVIGGWTALQLVNGDHLKEGSSREWGFADVEVEKGRVVEDPGVPGSENEIDEPIGLQVPLTSYL